jgi:hypothetical protein
VANPTTRQWQTLTLSMRCKRQNDPDRFHGCDLSRVGAAPQAVEAHDGHSQTAQSRSGRSPAARCGSSAGPTELVMPGLVPALRFLPSPRREYLARCLSGERCRRGGAVKEPLPSIRARCNGIGVLALSRTAPQASSRSRKGGSTKARATRIRVGISPLSTCYRT